MIDELGNVYSTEYSYKNLQGNTSGSICYSPYSLEKKYVPYITELPQPKVLYGFVSVKQKGKGLSGLTSIYEFEPYENAISNGIEFSMGNQIEIINQQLPDNILLSNSNTDAYARRSTIVNNLSSVGRLRSVSTLNSKGDVLSKESNVYFNPGELDLGLDQETFTSVKSFYNSTSKKYLKQYNATSKRVYPSQLKETIIEVDGKRKAVKPNSFDFYTGSTLSNFTKDFDGTEYRIDILPAYKINSHYAEMGPKSIDHFNKNMLSQEAATLSYIKDGDDWKPIGVSIQTWKNTWTDIGSDIDGNYLDGNGNFRAISLPNVWRKHKTFSWKGSIYEDGTYGDDFSDYSTCDLLISHWPDFEGVGVNGWQKTSEVTSYNRFSSPLEMTDINMHAASSITNLDATLTQATATNAGCNEFTHCGFEEEYNEGNWKIYNSNVKGIGDVNARFLSNNAPAFLTPTGYKVEEINAHTGNYYLRINGKPSSSWNTGGPEVELYGKGKSYIVSVWVHNSSTANSVYLGYEYMHYSEGSSPVKEGNSTCMSNSNSVAFGEWRLFKLIFRIPSDISSNGTDYIENIKCYVDCKVAGSDAYIDDFRVQPIDASVNAYVYDPLTDAITYILNNDNIATKYEYDDTGNLKATYKETPSGFKKVSEHNQGYARAVDNAIELASDVSVSSSFNHWGERTVSVILTLTNNDIVPRTVNLELNLENIGVNKVTNTIGGKQSLQIFSYFTVPGINKINANLKITGEISIQKSVLIDEIPPTLVLVEFTANNGDVINSISSDKDSKSNSSKEVNVLNGVNSNCSASIIAKVRNIGAPGSFSNIGWYVNSVLVYDLGNLFLSTGDEMTYYRTLSGTNQGLNMLELKYGEVALGYTEINCNTGGNPPVDPPVEQ